MSKIMMVGVLSASFALLATAEGEIPDPGSRSLYWQYPAESTAYETPGNWAVGSQSGEPATEPFVNSTAISAQSRRFRPCAVVGGVIQYSHQGEFANKQKRRC